MAVLVWISLKTEPGTRTYVQVIYLGNKGDQGVGVRDSGERGQERGKPDVRLYSEFVGNEGSILQDSLRPTDRIVCRRERRGGIRPSVPLPFPTK